MVDTGTNTRRNLEDKRRRRRPDGSVGMALVLPALTDCRWWFESLLVHSGVSSATRRKATGADHKKRKIREEEVLGWAGYLDELSSWAAGGSLEFFVEIQHSSVGPVLGAQQARSRRLMSIIKAAFHDNSRCVALVNAFSGCGITSSRI